MTSAVTASPSTELLRSVPMYRRLSESDRERVARVSQLRTYGRGETIFSEGDPASWFFGIASGRVKVFKMTPSGKDVILEIFGAGDPLGAVVAYEGRPFPASAVALEPTTCVATRREAFFELLEQNPLLVRGLLLGMTHRLIELTNRLAELTGGRLEPRFARFFLKLAEQTGRATPGGVAIALTLSRQELADFTGTTVESAIRIMSRWGKEGLVTTEKEGFVIADRAALEELALL
jgi:CRP/FNR family transcriptional regulator